MAEQLLFGPYHKGVNGEGYPRVLAEIINLFLKDSISWNKLSSVWVVGRTGDLKINGCKIASPYSKASAARKNDYDLSVTWEFDGVKYCLCKEIGGVDFHSFINKFNEIFMGEYRIGVSIDKGRDAFTVYKDDALATSHGATLSSPSVSPISTTSPVSSGDTTTKKFIPEQKIYFGTPGGGKSRRVTDYIEIEKDAKARSFRTTFHPDTDYASFVGSYKPVMVGHDITYAFIPQIFTKAYIEAWNNPNNDYYIVIEEINRGNCAQIFGDLFQLLDRKIDTGYSEYPTLADSDLANYLADGMNPDGTPVLVNKDGISGGFLALPPNLNILATMNTSDQSLFPMDSAFKRRWDWEFVPSRFIDAHNYDITIGSSTYKWHSFLKAVNEKIKDVTDSEDKQMGTHFIKKNVDEEAFKSKVMFYLWSEICKEEYKTQNNFFRYKTTEDGEPKEKEFTFNELYPDGSKILKGFMKYLKVKPVTSESSEEDKDIEEED